MSYTALILFSGGNPTSSIEFRNAWGGAARIWDALFKAHIPKKHEYDSWVCNPSDRRLWDIAMREDIPLFERAVHAFTFDHFYVRNEHFTQLAGDLRLFVEKYPAGQCVDHLPAWAKWLSENKEVEAVGLHATSVSENPWFRPKSCPHCKNETDDMEPVPLDEGAEVYDWIDENKNPRTVDSAQG